jgi:hypothetical protein
MNDLIKKEICDQHNLSMMASHCFHFLVGVLLLSSLMVTGTVSIVSCLSLVNLSISFVNHSSI